MKKIIALLLVSIMALSLVACGGKGETTPTEETKTTEETNTTEETKLTEEQQLIIDTVNTKMATEEVANWLSLCKDFTGEEAPAPKVTNVTHYQIPDFEGVEMDCYFVTVTSKFAHWVDEEAQQGALDENLYLFIDSNTKNVVDYITTDAGNVTHDTSTEEGRVTYLLWIYGEVVSGNYEGDYLNNSETVTELTEADLEVINNNLK